MRKLVGNQRRFSDALHVVAVGLMSGAAAAQTVPEIDFQMVSPNLIRLSFTANAEFQLEQTDELALGTWSPVGAMPSVIGDQLEYELPAVE